jgi:lantibiotic modifying enzyme
MGWKVFLPDRYIKPAEQKIHEIAGSLKESVPVEGGLLNGKAGLALFYSYYACWTRDHSFQALVADWIEQALNAAAGPVAELSLSNGLGGTAWLIHHLSSKGLLEVDAESIFSVLDVYLYNFMMQEASQGHYDYLHGALGLSNYFMRDPGNKVYEEYLECLVKELDIKAVTEPDGSKKWISVLDVTNGKQGYNLGLSHGMSSIIVVLSKLLKNGIARETTGKLLWGSLKYMDKQRLPAGDFISLYPSWALESIAEPEGSRLSWCYGDLGIGFAYQAAGRILKDDIVCLTGDKILAHAAERRDPGENRVYDAGICHGASGLALIFNILYNRTGLIQYREAALHWLDVCLNMSCHIDGIAGYKSWYLPEYGGWKSVPGLLEGAAGIGLCLLSFVSDQEPAWASSLLLL